MPQLAEKIWHLAPSIWRFVFNLVGALDERHLCLAVDPMDVNLSEVFKESERGLGDLGGNMPASKTQEEGDEDNEDKDRDEDEEEGEGRNADSELRRLQKRMRKDVPAKNLALQIIVSGSTLLTTL
jgi:hypothetical protein